MNKSKTSNVYEQLKKSQNIFKTISCVFYRNIQKYDINILSSFTFIVGTYLELFIFEKNRIDFAENCCCVNITL